MARYNNISFKHPIFEKIYVTSLHFIPEATPKECYLLLGYSNGLIVVYNLYTDKGVRYLNLDIKTGAA